MLVTALNKHIGYDNGAKLAKHAYQNNTTLRQSAAITGIISVEEFDKLVVPQKMICIRSIRSL